MSGTTNNTAAAAAATAETAAETATGRSSSSSHFSNNFETASVGQAEDTFYGITLSNDVLNNVNNNDSSYYYDWSTIGMFLIIGLIIFQPKIFQQRTDLSISFWILIISIAISIPQTTIIPLLSTIIYTRTAYPYLVVIPHCIVSVTIYRSRHGNNVPYLQSLILSFFLYGFGGSIVSDLLMGLPATALSHPRIVPCYIFSWLLVWFSPFDYVYTTLNNDSKSALNIFLKACEAVDAVTTPMGRVSRSARELRNKTTAPVVAGLLAGVGGGSLRHIAKEPSSSYAVLESAFWKTLWYSLLWWTLAVYPCTSRNFFFNTKDDADIIQQQEWNHCESYNGSDLIRVIIVSIHTLWSIFTEIGWVQSHPFIWISRKILTGQPATILAKQFQLGPSSTTTTTTTVKQKEIQFQKERLITAHQR